MKNALIIVDVQNDFCEGGSLAVPDANKIIPVINEIRNNYKDKFALVVLTQDFHPVDHCSFIDSPYAQDNSNGNDGTNNTPKLLFPRHCVQGTEGAEFHTLLEQSEKDIIIRKGENKYVENFSGFCNPKLAEILNKEEIIQTFVVGLAYDFCVADTALDSANLGYRTFVVKNASKGINENSIEEIEKDFKEKGVIVISSEEMTNYLY